MGKKAKKEKLVDCHIHMVLDGIDWKEAIYRHCIYKNMRWIVDTLEVYAKKGYTYLRDGGDRWGVGALAKAIAREMGIVYKTPLAPLSKKGHYGGFIGLQWENMREFAKLMELQRRQGADFCKIMVSGLMDFNWYGVLTEPSLTRQEIREMIFIIKSEGLSAMVHCNGAQAIIDCVEAGAESIEHGGYPNGEALAAMAQCGTVWCPTLSTVGNLRGKGRYDEEAVCAIFTEMSESVEKFSKMGGLVALGSDAGAWAVPHGCDTEREYLEALGVDWKRGSEVIMKRF